MCVALERSDRRSIVMERGKGGGKQGGREGAQALDVGSYFIQVTRFNAPSYRDGSS